MPFNPKISGSIETTGDANHRLNLKGNWGEVRRHDSDRFTGISIDTTKWNVEQSLGTADTIAISEIQGGSVLFTTGTVDDDSEMLSSAVIYSGDKKAVVEWKVKITDVSGTCLFVGFSDAKVEIRARVAIAYTDAAAVYTADNAVGFVIDADYSTSSIMCMGVKATVADTAVDTEVDWADAETKTLRVELDGDEARFYLDGASCGTLVNAVTSSTLLCATVQAMTRANDGANTAYALDYDAWQDE